MKILVMGFSGSGKTTFSKKLYDAFKSIGKKVNLHDADEVRKEFDDWDFSNEGRLRQTQRMKVLADLDVRQETISICCFICPKRDYRNIFNSDYMIWLNTIKESKYENTNKLFEPPINFNYMITNFENFDFHVKKIVDELNENSSLYNMQK